MQPTQHFTLPGAVDSFLVQSHDNEPLQGDVGKNCQHLLWAEEPGFGPGLGSQGWDQEWRQESVVGESIFWQGKDLTVEAWWRPSAAAAAAPVVGEGWQGEATGKIPEKGVLGKMDGSGASFISKALRAPKNVTPLGLGLALKSLFAEHVLKTSEFHVQNGPHGAQNAFFPKRNPCSAAVRACHFQHCPPPKVSIQHNTQQSA